MAGKTHSNGHATNNHFETLGGAGLDAVKNVTSTVAKGTQQELEAGIKAAWESLLGIGNYAVKGEMKEGQAVHLNESKKAAEKSTEKQQKPEKLKRVDIAPAYNYFAETFKSGESLSRRESSEIHYKINEIMVELKRLVSTSNVLQAEFKEVTMSETPKTPGKYHLNFFDWVLTIIRAARMKVEDSGAWLATMKGKKGKNGYWNMFKKHGTSFGLSSERNVSTQTG